MTARLCPTRPAEWWDPFDDGARLAIALCRSCPGRGACLDGAKPAGVIQAGIAFDDFGKPLPLCPTCGYPRTGRPAATCARCAVPTLGRWQADIRRWHAAGIPDERAGRLIGATGKQLRDTRRTRDKAKEAA